ncbi:MAG: nuclear transport factor 2 family protein [Bacteroidetes bacterium]|jgi:ketosteroid isomerase-like protein|nr:nuclear transport factor 2 family protein [Bacteroidota bacterium]MDF1867343.1 nuclear transport factor 2 family protein [Saprospiraceae bacterium]
MRYLAILIIIPFVFSNCQPKKNTPSKRLVDINQQKEVIKTTLINMWNAIEKGDIETYASYIHPDFTQFGENDPILKVGKEIEVNGVAEWIKSSNGIHTEMEDPLITIKDDVAWIVYYWRDRGTTDGQVFTSRGKSTRIFVKEAGQWLCIHGHYTLLPKKD